MINNYDSHVRYARMVDNLKGNKKGREGILQFANLNSINDKWSYKSEKTDKDKSIA